MHLVLSYLINKYYIASLFQHAKIDQSSYLTFELEL